MTKHIFKITRNFDIALKGSRYRILLLASASLFIQSLNTKQIIVRDYKTKNATRVIKMTKTKTGFLKGSNSNHELYLCESHFQVFFPLTTKKLYIEIKK